MRMSDSESDPEEVSSEANNASEESEQSKLNISVNPQSTPVDHLLMQGIDLGASSIHIEPAFSHARIRFRKGGLLSGHKYDGPPSRGLISIIKMRSHMDTERSGAPQNGVFSFVQNKLR